MQKNNKVIYVLEIITKVLLIISPLPITYIINNQISLIRTPNDNNISPFFIIISSLILVLLIYLFNAIATSKLERNNILSFSKRIKVKFKKRRSINILKNILTVIFYLLVIVYNFQDQFIFHPNYSSNLEYRISDYGYESIDINNEYYGWSKVDKTKVLPTIIYFGGNGESAAITFNNHYINNSDEYFENFNIFMIDYPSYGLSKGVASEESIFEMALISFDYISELAYVDSNNIIVVGFSLGSGVASYVAFNRDISKLVLLAPYNNFRETMNQFLPIFYGPLKLLVKNNFSSDKYLENIDIPILIVYSKKDEIVFSKRTDKLINEINNEKLSYFRHEELTHNEIPYDETTLFLINVFINK